MTPAAPSRYIPRPTTCLVAPPPGVQIAPDLLALAVDALEEPLNPTLASRDRIAARRHQLAIGHAYARAIDWTAMEWFWIEGGREWQRRHDAKAHSPSDGTRAPAAIPAAVKRAVAQRDRFRCRYCGIRVVTSATLTKLEQLLPAALPLWPAEMGPAEIAAHAAQCVLRVTWDHVLPRSRGGPNTPENVVTACGTCNYAKSDCTIEELSLTNPFDRPPPTSDRWDGLDGRLGSRRITIS